MRSRGRIEPELCFTLSRALTSPPRAQSWAEPEGDVECWPHSCLSPLLGCPGKASCTHWGTGKTRSGPVQGKAVAAVWSQPAQRDANASFHLLSLSVKIEHGWISLQARPAECGWEGMRDFCEFGFGFYLIIMPKNYINQLTYQISEKLFLWLNLININFVPIPHPTHLLQNPISEHAFKCSESADLSILVITNI